MAFGDRLFQEVIKMKKVHQGNIIQYDWSPSGRGTWILQREGPVQTVSMLPASIATETYLLAQSAEVSPEKLAGEDAL